MVLYPAGWKMFTKISLLVSVCIEIFSILLYATRKRTQEKIKRVVKGGWERHAYNEPPLFFLSV